MNQAYCLSSHQNNDETLLMKKKNFAQKLATFGYISVKSTDDFFYRVKYIYLVLDT